MQLDTGQWIVIGVSALLIVGYVGGFLYNRQLARKVLAWLYAGLNPFGQVTPGDPLGGLVTGGSLVVQKASEPYQRIEAIYFLEPRENLLFWFFDRLRGRRDELIVKINLRMAPGISARVEAGFKGDRNYQEAMAKNPKGWALAPQVKSTRLEIAVPEKNIPLSEHRRLFFEQYGATVTRISIAHQNPHIFVRARLKNLLAQPAHQFISAAGELSRTESAASSSHE